MKKLKQEDFTGTYKNKSVDLFILKNVHGNTASVTNYGARLVELLMPDKNGKIDNIIVGYGTLQDFLNHEEDYFGALIGRYANRIADGRFTIDGKEQQLEINEDEPGNHLHGGENGFHQIVWDAEQISEQKLTLHHSFPEEGGYPGKLDVTVHFEWTDDNELRIISEAQSDKCTILNLTYHPYFNLHGIAEGKSVSDHILQINADRYTPKNGQNVPTGELANVAGTIYDFRNAKPIGKEISLNKSHSEYQGDYDHNFVINKQAEDTLVQVAKIHDSESGRRLTVKSTEPGLQFYVCEHPVDGVESAFCLEPQHFPDSPNHSNFPSVVLEAGDTYRSQIVYKLEVTES